MSYSDLAELAACVDSFVHSSCLELRKCEHRYQTRNVRMRIHDAADYISKRLRSDPTEKSRRLWTPDPAAAGPVPNVRDGFFCLRARIMSGVNSSLRALAHLGCTMHLVEFGIKSNTLATNLHHLQLSPRFYLDPKRLNMKVLAIVYDGGEAAVKEPRLLGTTENKLGIADWLVAQGHELVVSSSKDGPDSHFEQHIVDAEVLITTPFHPGYLTRELMDKAKELKICITAGVGSDHIDLDAAVDHHIQVLEVSGSNVVSVAEHVVMSILILVRNFVPAHEMIERGDWQVSDIARDAFDLEGKVVGTIGAGRIGYRVLQRLQPFNLKGYLYYDYNPLSEDATKAVKATRILDLKAYLSPHYHSNILNHCDIVTVNAPLHEDTRNLINDELLSYFKPGAWLVNTARGAICDKDAVARALASGRLRGYSGDVWDVQPAPQDHLWRTMKSPLGGGNAMVPHYAGSTLDAQVRYAEGTKVILANYIHGKEQDPHNIIVGTGKYHSNAYGQR
ncbi:unnamed protein product [Mycena citricolor]|uniref:Formate dehydrogenase n=1 Tax=Mycena citricolor TaxID=2018698 RepID=A0AAD2JZH7_9AGAR|nr:unnamed protein product [Mycena citricolor]